MSLCPYIYIVQFCKIYTIQTVFIYSGSKSPVLAVQKPKQTHPLIESMKSNNQDLCNWRRTIRNLCHYHTQYSLIFGLIISIHLYHRNGTCTQTSIRICPAFPPMPFISHLALQLPLISALMCN